MLFLQQNNIDSNPEWRAFARQQILAQYANSPIILEIIDTFDNAVSLDKDAENFYRFAWNISTAIGEFLNIWGRIVNVNRVIQLPKSDYFGFVEGNYKGFGQAKFYAGIPASTNYALSNEAFRLMILAKALFNISRTTYSAYNKILMQLFPNRGRAYIGTSGNMNARLTFEFYLKHWELAILKQSNVFEPPTGVNFEIMEYPTATTFGFLETGRATAFGTGAFFRDFS